MLFDRPRVSVSSLCMCYNFAILCAFENRVCESTGGEGGGRELLLTCASNDGFPI